MGGEEGSGQSILLSRGGLWQAPGGKLGRFSAGDGTAGDYGRRRIRDDGRQHSKQPRSAEDYRNDESDGMGGQPRTDKSTKCQRSCNGRSPKLRRMRAKDGSKIPDKLLHTGRTERQGSYMPSLLCAPEAHSSLLGLAPTAANEQDSTRAPVSRARAVTTTSFCLGTRSLFLSCMRG